MVLKLQTSASNAIFYYAQNGNDNFLFYGFQVHESWVYSCNSRERPHPIFNTKCGSVKISYFRLCLISSPILSEFRRLGDLIQNIIRVS